MVLYQLIIGLVAGIKKLNRGIG